jgi:hypothetical protein
VPATVAGQHLERSTVGDIRAIADFDGDVIYEPTEDLAHANIVVKDKGLTEILTVTDVLLKHLKFLEVTEIAKSPLFSSCA